MNEKMIPSIGLKVMVFLCLTLVSIFFITIDVNQALAQKKILLRYAHGFSLSNPEGIAGTVIGEYIKNSPVLNDRIKYEHYPANSLFTTAEARVNVKVGGLEMTSETTSYLNRSVPEFQLCELPFLFNSAEHFYATMKQTEQGKKMMAKAEALGETFICERPSPNFFYKYWNNKKELRVPADFKEVKLRCAPGVGFTTVSKLLGASTIAMPMPEVVSAFQTGMIDGTMTNENGWNLFRLMEYCKYVTAVNVNGSYSWFVVNTKWWKKVPEGIKRELVKAMEAGAHAYTVAANKQRVSVWDEIYQLSNKGKYTVSFLTAEEKQTWSNMLKPLYEDLGEKYGGWEIINKAREIAPKFKPVVNDIRAQFKKL